MTTEGELIAYRRIGTQPPSARGQLPGIKADQNFTDEADGRTYHRPALAELLEYARRGDVVVVESMDRIARNTEHLDRTVNALVSRGVTVRFVKEDLTFTSNSTADEAVTWRVMQCLADFERALRRERQTEGTAIAKAKGVYSGREKALTEEQANEMRERAASGVPKAELARQFGVNRSPVYEHLKPTQ